MLDCLSTYDGFCHHHERRRSGVSIVNSEHINAGWVLIGQNTKLTAWNDQFTGKQAAEESSRSCSGN